MILDLINNDNVLNIYEFGSVVYNTNNKDSDNDYIVVVKDEFPNFKDNIKFENNHFNFYKQSVWENMMIANKIECLEAVFSNQKHHIKESIHYEIKIDSIELRKSISAACSNSYDKCRKKLIIKKDFNPHIARKSLWHSVRIVLFGIQCAKYGKIVNFAEANQYYDEIVNCAMIDWNHYKSRWHDFLNVLRSEFRKYSEKDWSKFKQNVR